MFFIHFFSAVLLLWCKDEGVHEEDADEVRFSSAKKTLSLRLIAERQRVVVKKEESAIRLECKHRHKHSSAVFSTACHMVKGLMGLDLKARVLFDTTRLFGVTACLFMTLLKVCTNS